MKWNLNLKIYWITIVWAKWQIIIPKECREDFKIQIWDEFDLIMSDKKAFGIWRWNIEREMKKDDPKFCNFENLWNLKIWTKFQFVIPCVIRKELWIESTDSLLVIWKRKNHKDEWIWFIKNDNIQYLLDFIQDYTKV